MLNESDISMRESLAMGLFEDISFNALHPGSVADAASFVLKFISRHRRVLFLVVVVDFAVRYLARSERVHEVLTFLTVLDPLKVLGDVQDLGIALAVDFIRLDESYSRVVLLTVALRVWTAAGKAHLTGACALNVGAAAIFGHHLQAVIAFLDICSIGEISCVEIILVGRLVLIAGLSLVEINSTFDTDDGFTLLTCPLAMVSVDVDFRVIDVAYSAVQTRTASVAYESALNLLYPITFKHVIYEFDF